MDKVVLDFKDVFALGFFAVTIIAVFGGALVYKVYRACKRKPDK